ncbi:MAG: hypothetical protein ACLRTD_26720 [Bacteroides sp.]
MVCQLSLLASGYLGLAPGGSAYLLSPQIDLSKNDGAFIKSGYGVYR